MAKLAFMALFLSLLLFMPTASEARSSGTSPALSASGSSKGQVRVLPAKMPESWLRGRPAVGPQRVHTDSTGLAPGISHVNEVPPKSENNSESVVVGLKARNGKEAVLEEETQENVDNDNSSDEKTAGEVVADSKTPKMTRLENTSNVTEILRETDIVHNRHSGIQLGRSSPRMKLKSSGDKPKMNDSVKMQDLSEDKLYSYDSTETPSKLTENRSFENSSSIDESSQESVEKLEMTSEENPDNEDTANELISGAQNPESKEGSFGVESDEVEKSVENLKDVANNSNILKTSEQRSKNDDALPVSSQNSSEGTIMGDEAAAVNADVEILKKTPLSHERSQDLKIDHHQTSKISNKIILSNPGTDVNGKEIPNEKSKKLKESHEEVNVLLEVKQMNISEGSAHVIGNNSGEPEGKQIQVEETSIDRKLTESDVTASTKMKQADVSKASARRNGMSIGESEAEQIEVVNTRNVNNSQPLAEPMEASNPSHKRLTLNVSNSVQDSLNAGASESTSNVQSKRKNPLALFPKIPSLPNKAGTSAKHSSIDEEEAHNSAVDESASKKGDSESNQSLHPKLRNKDLHQQPAEESAASSKDESDNSDDQSLGAEAVQPKMETESDMRNTGTARTAVGHPKLKPESSYSASRKTTNQLWPRRKTESPTNRIIFHPKLVNSNKQTQNMVSNTNADSSVTGAVSQNENKGVKNTAAVHPKLDGSDKVTRRPAKNGQPNTTGNNAPNSKRVDSKVNKEKLYKDISAKIENATKAILSNSTNLSKIIDEHTLIKSGNASKEIRNKEEGKKIRDTQDAVPVQTRRAKSEQLSNMVASIAIAIIVLVTIATIVGAVFKKLSFTRQRYGEHLPLSTEDYDDDDMPLYTRYQPPYESWKDMI